MSVETPGIFIQSGGETAERARRALAATFGGRGGIVAAGDLAVTENGTPNMSVNVATGQVVIPGTEGSFQGVYVFENRGALNVTIAASDPTNPRKDLIVAKVQDAAYSGGSNVFSIVAVTGTPAGSPAEPAAPANSWVLAMVDVPANDTAITNSQITDRRTQGTNQKGRAAALGGVIVCTSGNRPSHSEGLTIYETDTDKVFVSDGTNWTAPRNTAQGELGFTEVTSTVGSITTTEVTIASVTVTVGPSRKIRVTYTSDFQSTVADDSFELRLKESSTQLSTARFGGMPASSQKRMTFFWRGQPSAASHTYDVKAIRVSGTGTGSAPASPTNVIQLLVEDIGGV